MWKNLTIRSNQGMWWIIKLNKLILMQTNGTHIDFPKVENLSIQHFQHYNHSTIWYWNGSITHCHSISPIHWLDMIELFVEKTIKLKVSHLLSIMWHFPCLFLYFKIMTSWMVYWHPNRNIINVYIFSVKFIASLILHTT